MCTCTLILLTKIEASYKVSSLNVKLSEVQLLSLCVTFHTLPLFFCESKLYGRIHVKIKLN